jgi:hypothetical protein
MIDIQLGRIDIAHDGAKLIVDISRIAEADLPTAVGVGSAVCVCGHVKKRQRRTYFDASSMRLL